MLAVVLFIFPSCAGPRAEKPTPEAAKRFLLLRGYQFDAKSFQRAVAANDISAVDGFLAAGIDPNVRDEESGGTALIWATTHDEAGSSQSASARRRQRQRQGYGWLHGTIARAGKRNDAVAELMLAQPNLEVNAQGFSGMTALTWYVWSGTSAT